MWYQDQGEEDIGRDLLSSELVDQRLAWLAPEVANDPTGHPSITEAESHGLPPPEPPVANGEDDGGDAEHPDEEVGGDGEAGMDGIALAPEEEGGDEEDAVE